MRKLTKKHFTFPVLLILIAVFLLLSPANAEPIPIPQINLEITGTDEPGEVAVSLQLLALLTILSLAPAILIMMTSFVRIIIVLAFVRNALATQQMPPNQVLIGLALFLTFFVMTPTWNEVNNQAIQPYMAGEMVQEEAFERAMDPVRLFMLKQTREKDLALFINLSNNSPPEEFADIPNYVLIPAFIISELKTAFQLGFLIFLPFLVIDMVVASVLMSMGMMMLPPMMISLPFKILLFVLVDGWHLIVRSLVLSF